MVFRTSITGFESHLSHQLETALDICPGRFFAVFSEFAGKVRTFLLSNMKTDVR